MLPSCDVPCRQAMFELNETVRKMGLKYLFTNISILEYPAFVMTMVRIRNLSFRFIR
jgi:hypothetical protein